MHLRDLHIKKLATDTFDVLIIGGGINGGAAAAALAARGVKTALIDRCDFASCTSQQSSNLAWGGIKYLETLEFGLVRQLCRSRNRLLQHYPSSVREIRFLLTIQKGFHHHPLKLWCGTWLYWCMGDGFTRRPRWLSPRRLKREEPVIDTACSSAGLEYSDAYFYDNDARFVFNFVRAAMDNGCVAANYVAALGSYRTGHHWHTHVRDVLSGDEQHITSRVLINATGPFVDTMNQLNGEKTEYRHVFAKGIHLIVDRVTPNRRVLVFFAADNRLFFVIPMGSKTCIGTTDTRVDAPITDVTDADRRFVLDHINSRLTLSRALTPDDIIAERCGVRPLALRGRDEPQKDFLRLSRQHAIEVNRRRAHISIFGGKLTDCLNVGEEICHGVQAVGLALPRPRQKWYGEPEAAVRQAFLRRARTINLDAYTPHGASEPLSTRLWRRYGRQAFGLLHQIASDATQAEPMIEGTAFLRCEMALVAQREMVVTLEDFLRRRSKLALLRRQEDLRQAAGLMETCRVLFGAGQAGQKFADYFHAPGGLRTPTTPWVCYTGTDHSHRMQREQNRHQGHGGGPGSAGPGDTL